MKLRKIRCTMSFWLGLLALLVSGLAQNDLSRNVLNSTLTETAAYGAAGDQAGGHFMPNGTWMAGEMGGHTHSSEHTDPAKNGGHTHKGHSDCVLCGPLAAMAAFTHPPLVLFVLPETQAAPAYQSAEHDLVVVALRSPYASRAPPVA